MRRLLSYDYFKTMEDIKTLVTFELQGMWSLFLCTKSEIITLLMQQDKNLELFLSVQWR